MTRCSKRDCPPTSLLSVGGGGTFAAFSAAKTKADFEAEIKADFEGKIKAENRVSGYDEKSDDIDLNDEKSDEVGLARYRHKEQDAEDAAAEICVMTSQELMRVIHCSYRQPPPTAFTTATSTAATTDVAAIATPTTTATIVTATSTTSTSTVAKQKQKPKLVNNAIDYNGAKERKKEAGANDGVILNAKKNAKMSGGNGMQNIIVDRSKGHRSKIVNICTFGSVGDLHRHGRHVSRVRLQRSISISHEVVGLVRSLLDVELLLCKLVSGARRLLAALERQVGGGAEL